MLSGNLGTGSDLEPGGLLVSSGGAQFDDDTGWREDRTYRYSSILTASELRGRILVALPEFVGRDGL